MLHFAEDFRGSKPGSLLYNTNHCRRDRRHGYGKTYRYTFYMRVTILLPLSHLKINFKNCTYRGNNYCDNNTCIRKSIERRSVTYYNVIQTKTQTLYDFVPFERLIPILTTEMTTSNLNKYTLAAIHNLSGL